MATNSSLLPVPNPTPSYWLAEPHHLASYRSSDTVPEQCDVAIIGTGMAGVATAYHLLSRAKPENRPKVALFEARQVCSGATGRNGIGPGVVARPWEEASADLFVGGHTKLGPTHIQHIIDKHGAEKANQIVSHRMEQISAIKAVVEKEQLDCEFLLRRSFDVFWDKDQAQEVKNTVQQAEKSGYWWAKEVQWLEGPHLEKITGINGIVGATSCPAASLWPYKFVTQLLERVLKMGAELYAETTVLSVLEEDDGNLLKTSRGDLRASKVIFATNAYTGALLPQYSSVITPYRGVNSHVVATTKDQPFLESTYNLRYNPRCYDYLAPQPDGSIIHGGATSRFRGDNTKPDRAPWWNCVDDSTIIDGVEDYFENTMTERFRQWKGSGAKVDRIWTGIMAITPDSFPRVGQVEGRSKQWMLCGFNGAGMTMIFTMADAIARVVGEGIPLSETGLPDLFQSNATR